MRKIIFMLLFFWVFIITFTAFGQWITQIGEVGKSRGESIKGAKSCEIFLEDVKLSVPCLVGGKGENNAPVAVFTKYGVKYLPGAAFDIFWHPKFENEKGFKGIVKDVVIAEGNSENNLYNYAQLKEKSIWFNKQGSWRLYKVDRDSKKLVPGGEYHTYIGDIERVVKLDKELIIYEDEHGQQALIAKIREGSLLIPKVEKQKSFSWINKISVDGSFSTKKDHKDYEEFIVSGEQFIKLVLYPNPAMDFKNGVYLNQPLLVPTPLPTNPGASVLIERTKQKMKYR